MHIISLHLLHAFWKEYPQAENGLRAWHTLVEHIAFSDINHVRAFFNGADYVAPCTLFTICDTHYRVLVSIRYDFRKVYVKKIMTHREYDEWSTLNLQGKEH